MGAMLANRPPSQLPPRFALTLIFMGEGATMSSHNATTRISAKQSEALHWRRAPATPSRQAAAEYFRRTFDLDQNRVSSED